jgi:hypothetical protein
LVEVKLVKINRTITMYNHGTPRIVTADSTLTVVENKWTNLPAGQAGTEREIDQHVKSIRALISKMHPAEKQKYFNGLLAFILNEQIEMTEKTATTGTDYTKLSTRELSILEELSSKMQELYTVVETDTE